MLRLLSLPRHGIYKWQQGQTRLTRPRSVSFAGSTGQTPDPVFEHIHEPGGFRRNYVLLQGAVDEEGEPPRILNNFIDFLYIFGHFVSDPLSLVYLCILLTSVRREKTLRRFPRRTKRNWSTKTNGDMANLLGLETRPHCKQVQTPHRHRTPCNGYWHRRSRQSQQPPRHHRSLHALRRDRDRA